MDFLAFLKSGSAPGSDASGNEIEFDGIYFKRHNDVFPKFEVNNNHICEYLGSFTDYSLNPVNTWGGDLEYSIWRGSCTGYNIRIWGLTVQLYYAGSRVYEDEETEEESSMDSSASNSTSTASSSSGSIAWPSNPFAQWGMCILYALLPTGLLNLFCFPWGFVAVGGIFAFWFIMILCYYAFEKYMERDDSKSRSVRWYESLNKVTKSVVDVGIYITVLSVEIILVILGIVLLAHPISIFRGINYGGLIAIYVIAFAFEIAGGVFLCIMGKESRSGIIARKGTPLGVCSFVGCATMLALFISGMVLLPERWHLTKAKDFNIFLNLPNPASCTYYLDNDIDFNGSDSSAWNKLDFDGTFDGQGHAIKNYCFSGEVTYTDRDSGYAMFKRNYGTIKNLSIENSYFIIQQTTRGELQISSLCTVNETGGHITNCHVLETYFKITANHEFGGIACYNKGEISDCTFINHSQDPDYEYAITFFNCPSYSLGCKLCNGTDGINCVFDATFGAVRTN